MNTILTGGSVVLPDRVTKAHVAIHGRHIASVDDGWASGVRGDVQIIDIAGGYVLPGFIDVHVHGIEGHDTLDGGDVIAAIAAKLPRYGVTAFCPTTVACAPESLRDVLAQVARARQGVAPRSARVLPAHLESNFINPAFKGAQPLACLRSPEAAVAGGRTSAFAAQDILGAIAAARAEVGIITLAPELPHGLDLVRALATAGHRVSLGHSGADFETAMAAFDAGARHATHLFNRMTPITHRAPGLAGAVLARDDVTAELICDGYHVHPAMMRVAIAAKGAQRIMAITDGTAGSGLTVGMTGRLGGQPIHVGEHAATLADGTLAGSTLTMDRAFRFLVSQCGRSLPEAATMCATTPARALALEDRGVIAAGAVADLGILDRDLRVVTTIVDGEIVYDGRQ
ncbi:MAG TPA: N-acetylglucosamine-6-phosphate deacetylase [Vicinamibacterales bacterium]|jgi:N-acetylglucosamine-6-phosphate deacetylase|nr:N-acetylglucosamine-6-phosphate deacetylase [Vicinamibacterales bacterium]